MDRWAGCPPIGLGVKGMGSKTVRGGERIHDATMTMPQMWDCPSRWHQLWGLASGILPPYGLFSRFPPHGHISGFLTGEGGGVTRRVPFWGGSGPIVAQVTEGLLVSTVKTKSTFHFHLVLLTTHRRCGGRQEEGLAHLHTRSCTPLFPFPRTMVKALHMTEATPLPPVGALPPPWVCESSSAAACPVVSVGYTMSVGVPHGLWCSRCERPYPPMCAVCVFVGGCCCKAECAGWYFQR